MEIQKEREALFLDSLIDVDLVTSSQISFRELHVDGKCVFWTESRPLEKGRHALMKKESSLVELFPSMSIQTKVHEYGGGAFSAEKGCLVFFDAKTSSLYLQKEDSEPICLAQNSLKRWADFSLSPDLKTLICVCEDHSRENEVMNCLVSFDLVTQVEQIIHQSFDFYASPKWNIDGSKFAFLFWNFPSMPWDECCLKVISHKESQELFSIGGKQESISEFIWTNSGEIIFASDRNGFSNLYLWTSEGESLLYQKEADFSSPLWVFGKKSFGSFLKEGKEYLIAIFCEKAVDHLGVFDRESHQFHKLDLPFTVIKTLDVGTDGIYFIGGHSTMPLSLVYLDKDTFTFQVISSSFKLREDLVPFLSEPKEVSTLSSLDHQRVFGFFYPPKNPNYKGQRLPPLIIKCHSGPTAHVQPLLNLEAQFWTSRGFAWLDVNYRGSSGFGRKYREALNYNWGLLDVQDCLDLAESLVALREVDGEALFAKGSSSGGFTALCMAAISSKLRGCISFYGVTDLSLLTKDTHKFERHYLDSLIGSYKEFGARYMLRSPIHRSSQITCPVLFIHGDQDFVVPLSQAEELHKKLPASQLVVFQGEGHGFRKSDTIRSYLDAEVAFYKKALT